MTHTIREKAWIQPDGIIRLTSPDLPAAGVEAEVLVMFDDPKPSRDPLPSSLPPLSSLIGSAKGAFSTAREVDEFLQKERDAWR